MTEVYTSIFESISEAVQTDLCSIFDIKGQSVTVRSSSKLGQNVLNNLQESLLTESNAGLDREKITIDVRFDDEHEVYDGKIQESFNVKLKGNEGTFGLLNVSRYSPNPFSEDDKLFIEKLAGQGESLFNQLQHVVHSQKSKMQRLIEDLPDGIIMFDSQDDSILLNKTVKSLCADAGLTDIDKESLEKLFDLEFQTFYNDPELKKETFIREIKISRKDKKSIILDAHIASLYSRDGLNQGVLMALRDVTREREVERLKSKFISNVSHELRTPVATIKEFNSIIKDEIAGPVTDTQAEYMNIMESNLERLTHLIDNLLNMSLIEAGILNLRKTEFDINDVITTVVRSSNILFRKKDMTLKLEVQEKIQKIYADPTAVTQILVNCVDIARKFSERGSTVILRAGIDESDLQLEVRDFGRGIPKQDIDKIFDRFYRIEDKERQREEGSGLGLAIIKEFVELHEGTILVESELNEGTTLRVKIPIRKESVKPEVSL